MDTLIKDKGSKNFEHMLKSLYALLFKWKLKLFLKIVLLIFIWNPLHYITLVSQAKKDFPIHRKILKIGSYTRRLDKKFQSNQFQKLLKKYLFIIMQKCLSSLLRSLRKTWSPRLWWHQKYHCSGQSFRCKWDGLKKWLKEK